MLVFVFEALNICGKKKLMINFLMRLLQFPETFRLQTRKKCVMEKSLMHPLEQFLLLAKTAKGAAAVELVKQVLEAPGVYVFGELLDMPNILVVNMLRGNFTCCFTLFLLTFHVPFHFQAKGKELL